MQNYSTPPQSNYGGPPPPPAKKGLSKGCIIGIIAAGVAVIGAFIVIAAGVGGYVLLGRGDSESANVNATATGRPAGGGTGSSTSAGGVAEGPNPTDAQRAAVAGGQSAAWAQQEISWTVPQRWSKQEESATSFIWRSPGTWDAASLIVSISPMDASFPVDASINAFYQQQQTRKANGEVNEVRWLKLGGVKGVMFREAAPEGGDDPQRLQWLGYRNYKGQVQYVNIMLASRGKDFARHEDALYGILYSTSF